MSTVPSAEAVRAKITALKLSPQGERWMTQALYPPGDLTRVAIPTRTHYPTLRIEYRPSVVVSVPAGIAASANWDLLIYSPPTDATALCWVAGPAGTNFESATLPANTATGYLTTVPNLTTSTTAVNVCRRDVAGAATSTGYSIVQNPLKHMGFRITSKSYTAHMTASDLYNSGTVTTAQYDTKYQPESGFSLYAVRPVVSCLGTVPLNEDEITSSSPYAVVSAAKDGVFVPHRLMGPTFDFVRTLPARNRVAQYDTLVTEAIRQDSATSALSLGVAPFVSSPTGTYPGSLPWWMSTVWGTASRPDDSGFDSVTTGVSIFRGLNYAATITIVAHVGMENVLQVESPFRTLAGDPDEPDTRALNAYFEIAARMPHAYPASYNALGLVLPAIAQALRAVVPHLPKIWEGVKTVAPVVAPFLSGLLADKNEKKTKEKRTVRAIERRVDRDLERQVAGPARSLSRPRQRAKPANTSKTKQQIFARKRPKRR